MKYTLFILPVLILSACSMSRLGMYDIEKSSVQNRHIAYMKANSYCKSIGKYAFTRQGMDTATHYVYECK